MWNPFIELLSITDIELVNASGTGRSSTKGTFLLCQTSILVNVGSTSPSFHFVSFDVGYQKARTNEQIQGKGGFIECSQYTSVYNNFLSKMKLINENKQGTK